MATVVRHSVFEISKLLENFVVVSVNEGERQVIIQNDPTPIEPSNNGDIGNDEEQDTFTCSTAPGVVFATAEERALHYKSELHLWNLKLKSLGSPMISKVEYDTLTPEDKESMLKLDDSEDSEEDSDPKYLKGSNRIIIVSKDGRQLSFWKNAITSRPFEKLFDPTVYLSDLKNIHLKTKWAIFMSSGGRFAAGLFVKNACIKHRTFHRYVVRKKQGGTQSSKDKTGHAPKSAGATMRRYNETRYKEQIQETLADWNEDLKKTDLIFLFAPGSNWLIFFAGTKPLAKDDPRIRTVPFTVKRPLLDEVKRAHYLLSTVEESEYQPPEERKETEQIKDTEKITIDINNKIKEDVIKKNGEKHNIVEEDKLLDAVKSEDLNSLKKLIEEGYERLKPNNSLIGEACRLNNLEILNYLLEVKKDEELNLIDVEWFNRTALHRAAFMNSQELLLLLLSAGADIAVRDIQGNSFYDLIKEKSLREEIRRYAGVNSNDWKRIGVPVITPEMDEARKTNKKEINKKKNNKKKAIKGKIKKQQEKDSEKQKQEEEQQKQVDLINKTALERETKIANLSEREKRAIAAESRLNAASGKAKLCSFCQQPITSIPFERLKYQYCCIACVQNHMKILDI